MWMHKLWHFSFRECSDCHISIEKAKSIYIYISHVLRVISRSYLNSNINYHVCFPLSLRLILTCQNSNGIAILFVFEFPMSTREAANHCQRQDYTRCRVCFGKWRHSQMAVPIHWSMEVISKGSAKDSCQSVHACVNEQTVQPSWHNT